MKLQINKLTKLISPKRIADTSKIRKSAIQKQIGPSEVAYRNVSQAGESATRDLTPRRTKSIIVLYILPLCYKSR